MIINSLVCTPFGFKPLKDIKVGDVISNPMTGGQQEILYLHPIGEYDFYRVYFDDQTYTDCSEGHLWNLRIAGRQCSKDRDPITKELIFGRVWETKEIYEYYQRKKSGMYKNHSLMIPLTKPISFNQSEKLPIDPYVMGHLLGDGCFTPSILAQKKIQITTKDPDILSEYITAGWRPSKGQKKISTDSDDSAKDYFFNNQNHIRELDRLGLSGKYAIDKFIPDVYLHASVNDRYRLIQGLFDADACVLENGRVMFVTTSKKLAEGVKFIIGSLGGYVTINPCNAFKTKHPNWNTRYDVNVNIEHKELLFCLPRKKARCINAYNKPNKRVLSIGKHIVNVEFIGKKKSRCITVSDPNGLYVTDNFTVTHNSYIGSTWLCSSCIRFPNLRMGLVRKQLKDIKNSTLVTIKKVLTGWGLVEDVNYSINNLTNIISFWNGSEILMMELADLPSDADFSRIGSLELSGVMVEEGSEISERAADTIFSRIRWQLDKSFKVPKMFIGTNPAPCWLRSRFVQDDDGNPVECRDNERFIRFSVWDNPDDDFRRTYEASLNRIKDNATRERLLYGNWDFSEPNAMAIYSKFNGEKHLESGVKDKYYDPLKPVIVSLDFNVAPHMSSLVTQIDYDAKKVYIFSEVLGLPKDKENNTPAFAKKLRQYLLDWRHVGGTNITGDPSGKQRSTTSEDGVNNYTIITEALGDRTLRPTIKLFKKQPPQKTRCEFVNDVLDGYEGWTVIIDNKCRKLIEDLIYQPKNEDGTKSKKKVTDPKTGVKYEKYGHLSDCLDYLLCYFLKDSYNSFVAGNGGIDTVTSAPAGYSVFNY